MIDDPTAATMKNDDIDGGVLFEKHVKQLLVLAVVDATCRGYLDIEE